MTRQVMNVVKPLGSVHRIVKGGITVVSDGSGGRIINGKTGSMMMMREKDGPYEVDLWVKSDQKRRKPLSGSSARTQNRFSAIGGLLRLCEAWQVDPVSPGDEEVTGKPEFKMQDSDEMLAPF